MTVFRLLRSRGRWFGKIRRVRWLIVTSPLIPAPYGTTGSTPPASLGPWWLQIFTTNNLIGSVPPTLLDTNGHLLPDECVPYAELSRPAHSTHLQQRAATNSSSGSAPTSAGRLWLHKCR